MTRFPSLSNERNGKGQISATSCGDDLLNQKDSTATGPESIPSSPIHSRVPVSVLVPPCVPNPLSALAPVPVPTTALDATAITDDDNNRDKSNSTSAHSKGEITCNSEGEIPCNSEGEIPCNSEGEIPCNSEGEIPCNSEGTISLLEPMFR
jgi:hypothetical protein